MKLRELIDKIMFPMQFKCIICNREIFDKPRYNICSNCVLEFNDQRICQKCGSPMYNEADYCEECKKSDNYFFVSRSALIYKGNAKKLIMAYKYGGKKYLYKPFAKIMADTYIKLDWEIDLIIPAPISKQRLKVRGFNQSLLLAKELSDIFHIPLENDFLYKIKNMPYQARSSRGERFEQVKGVFAANADIDIKGKKIMLVDDVMTTGATVNELSRILINRKAEKVYVLVLAQPEKKVKALY